MARFTESIGKTRAEAKVSVGGENAQPDPPTSTVKRRRMRDAAPLFQFSEARHSVSASRPFFGREGDDARPCPAEGTSLVQTPRCTIFGLAASWARK